MGKRKQYREIAVRMKNECKEYRCRECQFDRDLKRGWGTCDYVFYVCGEKLPRDLTVNQISDSIKGLTVEKALKELN